MTINMTLRLPNDIAAKLDQITTETGQSRHALILSILNNATQRTDTLSPDLVLGYIQLTNTELTNTDCPQCHQPLTHPAIGFTAGVYQPQTFGPICTSCAQT